MRKQLIFATIVTLCSFVMIDTAQTEVINNNKLTKYDLDRELEAQEELYLNRIL